MMTRTLRARIAFGVIVVVSGCGGESAVTPNASTAGSASAAKNKTDRTLAIELTTSATGDAGMIFSIEGPNLLDVVPADGFDLVRRPTDATGRAAFDVVLVGPLQSGVVAYAVAKGGNPGQTFSATVNQVAAGASGGFALRTNLAAYQLSVVGR